MAIDGRIVLIWLGKLTIQPLTKGVALGFGSILEANACLGGATSPGQLAINLEWFGCAGEFRAKSGGCFPGQPCRQTGSPFHPHKDRLF